MGKMFCGSAAFALLLSTLLPIAETGYSIPIDHKLVHFENTLGVAMTDHAQTAVDPQPRKNTPRERPPIVYFYSRGGRQITNRGAEVFHQLHHAVRREGIMSYLEDGVDKYATSDSQYIEDYEEIFELLGPHDNVVVTSIPHGMDESIGVLLPPYTGAPFLGNRTRVIKWQIGYSFPSISYFVDERQHMICDTYFLMDVMGCVKEAYIRAPPLPLYYDALEAAVEESRRLREEDGRGSARTMEEKDTENIPVSAGESSPLAIFKERLVLYDNDHTLDTSLLKLNSGCVLQELDGLTREQMVAAYKKAVVVIDLWLPGAETVTAEGAMFDCCVLVPRDEMNGANQRDFPISPHLKIGRTQDGNWNYTEISNLLNRALDDYDNFIHEFHKLKAHVMALPATFQSSVHRYFANDIHFVAGAFSSEQQALVIPWAVSVLMNYPLATIDILVHNRIKFGMAHAHILEVLRRNGIKQSITVSDAFSQYGSHLYQGRRTSPWIYSNAMRESSLTCFADPRATLLRPDLLTLVEKGNSSSWHDLEIELVGEEAGRGKEGETGKDAYLNKLREPRDAWALECFRVSDFSVIPQETGWADLEDTWRLRHWPGFLFFEEGLPQAPQNGGKKPSHSNCLHLEDMYSNSVYRGVFPFFSGRYRRFVERTLKACGLASVTLPNDFGDSLHTQIS